MQLNQTLIKIIYREFKVIKDLILEIALIIKI